MNPRFSYHVIRSLVCGAIAGSLTAGAAAPDFLSAALDHPVVAVNGDGRVHLKIALSGRAPSAEVRAPANVAIVLDRSGSMQGEKIVRAREAALTAVGRLGASTVFDGVRRPRLYRVQDAVTGRTIAYLKPDPGFDLAAMLGQTVGVGGPKTFEDELSVNLVSPRRIDLVSDPS